MNKLDISLPQLAFVAGTRGLGGAGIGLLLGDFFDSKTRRAVGWTLLTIGVLTTIPIAIGILTQRERLLAADEPGKLPEG
jgi:hypothetical protein